MSCVHKVNMTHGGEQKQKNLSRFTNSLRVFSFLLYLQNSFSLKIITLISVVQFFNITPLVYVSTNFHIIWSVQGLWKYVIYYNFIQIVCFTPLVFYMKNITPQYYLKN